MIDIGSNSIRLVIFDVTEGYPRALYNERVFCQLGSGVGASGALPPEAVELALVSIKRLVHVARLAGVRRLEAFATSAVRDASNGDVVLSRIRSCTDCRVEILSEEDEARLAAEAVLRGLHVRRGIVADLGGGSLELAGTGKGLVDKTASLPLGTVRLLAKTRNDRDRMEKEVAGQLDSVGWLNRRTDRTLFLVGGAWRAFARLRIAEDDHSLKIIHGYSLSVEKARETARKLSELDESGLAGLPDDVSKRRTNMPVTGLILLNLVDRLKLKRVTFSGVGVREGYVIARMSPSSVARDPLMAGVRALARREARYGDATDDLMAWLAPLFPEETSRNRRVHAAVCALSDAAWREHPDHRAQFAFERFLHHPFPAIAPSERVFMALALHVRYGGGKDDACRGRCAPLLSRRSRRRAEVLGHALHLAYRISAGNPELLRRSHLRVRGGKVSLRLSDDETAPHLSRIERSFKRLCEARHQRVGPIAIGAGPPVRQPNSETEIDGASRPSFGFLAESDPKPRQRT